MKLTTLLLLLSLCIIAVACGDDEDCTQADWTGTWELDDASVGCSDPSIEVDSIFTISPGATMSTIEVNGFDYAFMNCSVIDPFFGIEMKLDGDEISFSGLGCTGSYNRQ